jgi:hypothetical protein
MQAYKHTASRERCFWNPSKSNGRFGGRKHLGKPRCRWNKAVWRDAVYLLHVRHWRAAARKREGWTTVIGEATARELAEA